MFILKKGHQPGVYVPLRALFLVLIIFYCPLSNIHLQVYVIVKAVIRGLR